MYGKSAAIIEMLILAVGLLLIVQKNCDTAADKQSETYPAVDKSSSSRATAAAMEGYLNYKATHHEGKVSMIAC